MVGTSGAAATRCGVDTTMARTWLPLAVASVVMLSIASWMLPPIMLFISSAVERNGTRHVGAGGELEHHGGEVRRVPLPDEPNVTLPSLLHPRDQLRHRLAGTSLLTTSRFGSRTSSEIGAKSFHVERQPRVGDRLIA
jgi:hypothetical protein